MHRSGTWRKKGHGTPSLSNIQTLLLLLGLFEQRNFSWLMIVLPKACSWLFLCKEQCSKWESTHLFFQHTSTSYKPASAQNKCHLLWAPGESNKLQNMYKTGSHDSLYTASDWVKNSCPDDAWLMRNKDQVKFRHEEPHLCEWQESDPQYWRPEHMKSESREDCEC